MVLVVMGLLVLGSPQHLTTAMERALKLELAPAAIRSGKATENWVGVCMGGLKHCDVGVGVKCEGASVQHFFWHNLS